jgi:ATPase MipZ
MAIVEQRDETPAVPGAAHVVVVASEKGGTGKSTLAVHIAVALLKAGRRVATIDLDSRQQSFTHHFERRCIWGSSIGRALELPRHHCVALGDSVRLLDNEASEFTDFTAAVEAIEHCCDFVVVDAPGADTFLARLAHAMADTLVTPLNDSMVDRRWKPCPGCSASGFWTGSPSARSIANSSCVGSPRSMRWTRRFWGPGRVSPMYPPRRRSARCSGRSDCRPMTGGARERTALRGRRRHRPLHFTTCWPIEAFSQCGPVRWLPVREPGVSGEAIGRHPAHCAKPPPRPP